MHATRRFGSFRAAHEYLRFGHILVQIVQQFVMLRAEQRGAVLDAVRRLLLARLSENRKEKRERVRRYVTRLKRVCFTNV